MILKRIYSYANKTKIQLDQGVWQGNFNIRGFCPHLRKVILSKKDDPRWIAHDLLHIFFYDFVYISLGSKKSFWKDKNRFFETHLASEAFAVLALDYFYLSNKKGQTLTIDLDAKDWPRFQKMNPLLPPMHSVAFIKIFKEAYFNGNYTPFKSMTKNKKYSKWLDHEISYSKKQRIYVSQWWEDLHLKKISSKEIFLYGSQFDGLLQEALNTLYASNKEWDEFLKYVGKRNFPKNYFSHLPKFQCKPKKYDFRFTSIESLKTDEMAQILKKSFDKPTASSLFLMWQIFASCEQKAFTQNEKKLIEKLYVMSQKGSPNVNLWSECLKIAAAKLRDLNINSKPEHRANFFLQ